MNQEIDRRKVLAVIFLTINLAISGAMIYAKSDFGHYTFLREVRALSFALMMGGLSCGCFVIILNPDNFDFDRTGVNEKLAWFFLAVLPIIWGILTLAKNSFGA